MVRGRLANTLANVDEFVHPNSREPFGIGPLEAMASGVALGGGPDTGGVLTYASGETAWLAPPEPEAFARAVREVTSDPERRRQTLLQAVAHAGELAWPRTAGRFVRICDCTRRRRCACMAELPCRVPVMIDRIVVENFKSLRRVDLTLGRMNLFVGANASGKSNFLDLLRVLQGIGNGFTISEILDGKPRSATSAVWEGIRGGSRRACFAGPGKDGRNDEVTIEVHGRFAGGPGRTWVGMEERDSRGEPALNWELLLSFSPLAGCVARERFKVGAVIYDTDRVEGFSQRDPKLPVWCSVEGSCGWTFELQPARPALGQLGQATWQRGIGGPEDVATQRRSHLARMESADQARGVARLLANIQPVEPELPVLRAYSKVSEVRRMGDRGEDFAALVQVICKDDRAKDAYLSWLRQLRPEEVDDVRVRPGAMGEPLFVLQENGREFPAAVLSDGTLRFAALAAAFFQPDMPDLMTIEEIENGIHASRARLLLELLRSQAEAARTQVVATTHSAAVLDWLGEEDYRTTFLCKRDEETGESRICALTDVPHFIDVVKKRPVSELLSEGWLEAAL